MNNQNIYDSIQFMIDSYRANRNYEEGFFENWSTSDTIMLIQQEINRFISNSRHCSADTKASNTLFLEISALSVLALQSLNKDHK